MATVQLTAQEITARGDHGHIITWVLTDGDIGSNLEMIGSARRSVQIAGTFGGGSIHIEGSNDGINFSVLTDAYGNQLKFAGAGVSAVGDLVAFTRPKVFSGTGVSVTISMLVRKETR